jgi:DNA-binding transcriptional ArsR family regulator
VKPETNEYEALSFLVRNRDYGFRPSEIAEQTAISKASASKTMARLFEKGLVERSEGLYYVDPDCAGELKQRLDSLDAAVRLFDTAPADDAYTEPGWEETLPSIDSEQDHTGEENSINTNTITETDATTLVDQLSDETDEE